VWLELAERQKLSESDLATFRGQLGESLTALKRYAEAETVLLATYDELKRTKSAANTARAAEIARLLAQGYEATNQPQKVAEWQQKTSIATGAPAK
jgi:hypothetical protein